MRLIYERENDKGIKHKYVLGRTSPSQGRWCTNTSSVRYGKEIGPIHKMDWGCAPNGTCYDWMREIVASTDKSLGLPPIDEIKLYAIDFNFKYEVMEIYHVTIDIMDAWDDCERFHSLEEAREGIKSLVRKISKFDNHPMINEVDNVECVEIDASELITSWDEYLKKELSY